MRQYSIRKLVALLTLAPLLLLAITLESIFLHDRFAELDRNLVERGQLIARQLASSSEYGAISNNQTFLKKIANDTLRQPDMSGVMVMNAASQILIDAGKFSDAAKNALSNIKLEALNHPGMAGITPGKQSDHTRAGKPDEPAYSPFTIHDSDESLLIGQPIIPENVMLDELEAASVAGPVGAVFVEVSRASTEKLKSKMLWSTVAATTIFLILIVYLIRLASRSITYPVSLLSDAVQKIGRGDLGKRVAGFSHIAELGILAHGINEMAAKLQLESTNLQRLVEERTSQATQARLFAESAQQVAEHANTAKSKFLAAASHDLRQPIHAQGLFLDVLSRTELTPHQHELLSSARTASKASMEMLNALLDFSRIEAGVVKPQVRPFLLQPLLNKIENEFAPQADAKGLVYRSRETDLAVLSDPMLVELILRNLVSNAIRYTGHGGLLVACRRRGNRAMLEVWDTGIGIEPADQQEVFREFHQLGNPERDSRKGLGLGLAISDALARTLGHGLSLVSTPLRGSVFRLTLPIATGTLPVNVPAVARGNAATLDARILVIDDDEAVRAAMLHLLRNWGCECEAVESIEEALAMARSFAPDVIVSDYRLRKQRTGAEAITALRALLGNNLPALLITGDTAPERLREAQASGIPLLHKPVSPGDLYCGLMEVLEGTG